MDSQGFNSRSFEHLPYGGHGYPGRTLDTLSGAGLDVRPSKNFTRAYFHPASGKKIEKVVKAAFLGLIVSVCSLLTLIFWVLIG